MLGSIAWTWRQHIYIVVVVVVVAAGAALALQRVESSLGQIYVFPSQLLTYKFILKSGEVLEVYI
jgi:hypothetical protein